MHREVELSICKFVWLFNFLLAESVVSRKIHGGNSVVAPKVGHSVVEPGGLGSRREKQRASSSSKQQRRADKGRRTWETIILQNGRFSLQPLEEISDSKSFFFFSSYRVVSS